MADEPKRSINLPVAEALATDDVYIIDSPTLGTRQISALYTAPGGTGAGTKRSVAEILAEPHINVMDFHALGDGSGAKYTEFFEGGAHDLGIGATTAADINAYFGMSGSFSSITTQNATIDFIAHYAAWQRGQETGLPVYTPPGVYIIGEMFRIFINNKFHWFGAGASSIMKREPGIVASTLRMAILDLSVRNDNTIDEVRIENLFLDGNARENPPAWSANQVVAVGDFRRNREAPGALDRLYQCVTAGTTASSGGPLGTGAAIVDGTAAWDYLNETRRYTSFEFKPLIRIAPTSSNFSRIRHVLCRDITMTDTIADGIMLPWQADVYSLRGVDVATFENVRTLGRERTRADIIMFSSVRKTFINNCTLFKLETEYERPPSDEVIFISNSNIANIELGGDTAYSVAAQDAYRVYLQNVICERYMAAFGTQIAVGCDLGIKGAAVNLGRRKISNSILRLDILDTLEVNPIRYWEFMAGTLEQHWSFSNVHFDWNVRQIQDVANAAALPFPEFQRSIWQTAPYAWNVETNTFWIWNATAFAWVDLGLAVFDLPAPAVFQVTSNISNTNAQRWVAEFENCTFRKGFDYNLVVDSAGTVRSTRNTFNADIAAIKIQRTLSDSSCMLESIEDNFKAAAAPLAIGQSRVPNEGLLRIVHAKTSEWGPSWISEHANAADMAIVSDRRFQAATAPTGGLRGDVVHVGNLEYTCVTTHPTAATWAVLGQMAPIAVDASAGDTTADLVASMEFGKTYEIKLEETTPFNGATNKSFSLGDGATADVFLAAVTATGTAVGYAVVSGTENVGLPLRVTVTNNASATAGVVTATVIVK